MPLCSKPRDPTCVDESYTCLRPTLAPPTGIERGLRRRRSRISTRVWVLAICIGIGLALEAVAYGLAIVLWGK